MSTVRRNDNRGLLGNEEPMGCDYSEGRGAVIIRRRLKTPVTGKRHV